MRIVSGHHLPSPRARLVCALPRQLRASRSIHLLHKDAQCNKHTTSAYTSTAMHNDGRVVAAQRPALVQHHQHAVAVRRNPCNLPIGRYSKPKSLSSHKQEHINKNTHPRQSAHTHKHKTQRARDICLHLLTRAITMVGPMRIPQVCTLLHHARL